MPAVSAEYAAGQGCHRQVHPTFDNCIKPWKIEAYPQRPAGRNLPAAGHFGCALKYLTISQNLLYEGKYKHFRKILAKHVENGRCSATKVDTNLEKNRGMLLK